MTYNPDVMSKAFTVIKHQKLVLCLDNNYKYEQKKLHNYNFTIELSSMTMITILVIKYQFIY